MNSYESPALNAMPCEARDLPLCSVAQHILAETGCDPLTELECDRAEGLAVPKICFSQGLQFFALWKLGMVPVSQWVFFPLLPLSLANLHCMATGNMPDHIRKILIEARHVISPSSTLSFASDPDTYNLGTWKPHVAVILCKNGMELTFCLLCRKRWRCRQRRVHFLGLGYLDTVELC